uniref:hypothetical protein n=1 Tax=Paractinoplanes polyasparticus TaxID=2856853 RepID=UPI001C84D05E|nr:hypothetical protein [Actinoplanes polyasparticus]
MTVIRSILLFVVAAIAEIGGAWLIWQGIREHKGLLWIGAGIAALGAYGFVATLQIATPTLHSAGQFRTADRSWSFSWLGVPGTAVSSRRH